ncbi:hypothetical protein [Flexithrix dorotheae]|uniref:hypothetical protein n=1 Tax=Flexithrix dorotheae TaxID=70993 RepID=UPI00037F41F2|nr:hypothetical protein [Flexithrix dorotheae]
MTNNTNNSTSGLSYFINKILPKVEMTGLVITLIGGLFWINNYQGGNNLLTLGLVLVAICNLILGFGSSNTAIKTPSEKPNFLYHVILPKLINLGISIAAIGTLLDLLFLPGSKQLLLISGLGLMLLLIIRVVVKPESLFKENIDKKLVFFALLSIYLWQMEPLSLYLIKYKGHPELINLFELSLQDPENPKYRNAIQEYKTKNLLY